MKACLLLSQDPEDEDEAAALSVDWRAYSQTHTLTDKQQKLAEKIRKRENRIGALQKEVDKIRVGIRLDMRAVIPKRCTHHLMLPWSSMNSAQALGNHAMHVYTRPEGLGLLAVPIDNSELLIEATGS